MPQFTVTAFDGMVAGTDDVFSHARFYDLLAEADVLCAQVRAVRVVAGSAANLQIGVTTSNDGTAWAPFNFVNVDVFAAIDTNTYIVDSWSTAPRGRFVRYALRMQALDSVANVTLTVTGRARSANVARSLAPPARASATCGGCDSSTYGGCDSCKSAGKAITAQREGRTANGQSPRAASIKGRERTARIAARALPRNSSAATSNLASRPGSNSAASALVPQSGGLPAGATPIGGRPRFTGLPADRPPDSLLPDAGPRTAPIRTNPVLPPRRVLEVRCNPTGTYLARRQRCDGCDGEFECVGVEWFPGPARGGYAFGCASPEDLSSRERLELFAERLCSRFAPAAFRDQCTLLTRQGSRELFETQERCRIVPVLPPDRR